MSSFEIRRFYRAVAAPCLKTAKGYGIINSPRDTHRVHRLIIEAILQILYEEKEEPGLHSGHLPHEAVHEKFLTLLRAAEFRPSKEVLRPVSREIRTA